MTENNEAAPRPWKLHNTGGYIAILAADGKTVIRKTTSVLAVDQYRELRANFEFIVTSCNESDIR